MIAPPADQSKKARGKYAGDLTTPIEYKRHSAAARTLLYESENWDAIDKRENEERLLEIYRRLGLLFEWYDLKPGDWFMLAWN
jgi:hypothetical protein